MGVLLGAMFLLSGLAGTAMAVAPTDLPGPSSLGQTIVNPDGSIIGAGITGEAGSFPGSAPRNPKPLLLKLRSDGSVDSGFASGGVHFLSGHADEDPVELMPAADGEVILATSRHLLRFKADGTLDPSFGTGGKVGPLEFGGLGITAAAIQDDGRIVVATGSYEQRVYAARFTATGKPDTSFGTGGVAHLAQPDPPVMTGVAAIGFDGNDRILLGGMGPTSPVAARLLPDGQLDTGFGPGGSGYSGPVASPHDPWFSSVEEIDVDPDGDFRLYGVHGETYAWANLGASFGADGLVQGDTRRMGNHGSGVFAETPDGVATTDAPGRGGPVSFNVAKTDRDGEPASGFTKYEPALAPGNSSTEAITYSPEDDTLIATGSATGYDCGPRCLTTTYMAVAKIDADTGAPVAGFGQGGATLIPSNTCTYGEVAYDSPSPWRHCRVKPPKVKADFEFRRGASKRPMLFGTVTLAGIQEKPELMERHLTITLPQKIRLRRGAKSKLYMRTAGTGDSDVNLSLTGRNIRVDVVPRGDYDEMWGDPAPLNEPVEVFVGLRRGAIAKIRRPFRRMPLKFGLDAIYTPSSVYYGMNGVATEWYEPNRTVTDDRVRPLQPRKKR